MDATFTYDHRTNLSTSLGEAALDFAANVARPPVSFRARVREPFLLRSLLSTLHRVITGDFRWMDQWEFRMLILDPVITVHPDELCLEAFSSDESCYARLSCPQHGFDPEGETSYGTTNIDFTWELRDALQGMRTSQQTTFAVGAEGFGVEVRGARDTAHYERKVDVPDSWVKGFLQVQAAFTMHPFSFSVDPVDLLTVIAFFQDHRPPGPPHGLRYEFAPGKPIAVVLEPWEERLALRGTQYDGYERTVRVWGRRRLELLQHLLPCADRVTVSILGRGLPHCYTCHFGDYRFTLALSGWTGSDWSRGAAFDLLAPRGQADPALATAIHERLSDYLFAEGERLAEDLAAPRAEVEHALFGLCRAGRVMYDPNTRLYRLRELFAEPLDVEALFPPDTRLEQAERLLEEGRVTLSAIEPPDANPRRETRAEGTVEDVETYEALVAVDLEGRLRFATCECPFFKNHIMSRGPCEHVLAARLALDRQLQPASEAGTMAGDEMEG